MTQYCIDDNNVAWRNIDGEVVLINFNSGCHYSLNKIGSSIWLMFCDNKSQDDIIENIVKKYDISPKKAEDDLLDLVELLKKEDLIIVRD